MAVTLKGKGVCWGVGASATVGIVINATSLRQSADYTVTPNTQDLLDQNGVRVGRAYIDYEQSCTITVVPAGANYIAAQAESTAIFAVVPGTPVTVTDAHSTDGASAVYMAEGSRLRETNSGAALIEVDMVKLSGITDVADIAIA